MKRLICVLLAVLLLSATALAETKDYVCPEGDIAFTYDDEAFEIIMDDEGDDEHLVLLSGKREAWKECSVRIHLRELKDGEAFTTLEDMADLEQGLNTKATQGEWNGYRDVITYDIDDETSYEQVFIVPIYDDDAEEVESILTVNISVTKLDDEEAGMERDDAISSLVVTLKVDD